MTPARRSNLFDAPARVTSRPAPTPAVDPRVHVCRTCHRIGATFGVGEAWFCRAHVPADFFPKNRGAA